jgi:Electron transfer DM13
MKRNPLVMGIGFVVALGAWYAFRPERLFINQKVNESFPAASAQTAGQLGAPKLLAMGNFHSVAHKTTGVATIHELPDGKRVLRLTQFETSNGPAVHVYLVAAPDAADSGAVKRSGFIDIAPLKGNVGDQNYDLPAGVDLTKYRAVTIWCQRFGVNFATAPLAAPAS